MSVVPRVNLVENIGFGSDATHTVNVAEAPALKQHSIGFPLVHPPSLLPLRSVGSSRSSNCVVISFRQLASASLGNGSGRSSALGVVQNHPANIVPRARALSTRPPRVQQDCLVAVVLFVPLPSLWRTKPATHMVHCDGSLAAVRRSSASCGLLQCDLGSDWGCERTMKCNNILEAVGHSPLVRLNRMAKDCPGEVWVKADYLNPGGSVKDRIGITMIDDAERRGLLKPGGTIVEGTSGNTGMGLALVAAVRGYKMIFTITDKQSKEKVDLLKALGAEVIVCPTAVEPADPRSYYSVAKRLAQEIPNSYYPNQYENPMIVEAHYHTTGPEIWDDSGGKITHFVCGMGTGGTITGVGRYLKEKNPQVKIIGVDPIGSLYYEFCKIGKVAKAHTYVVEGIGEDIFPSTMDFKVLDDVLQVNDRECFVVARALVKSEGLFTGGSGGGCVSPALRLARELPAEAFVVAFLPDTGMRWFEQSVAATNGCANVAMLKTEVPLTAKDIVAAKHRAGLRRAELIIVRPTSNRLPRASHHAGTGHFSIACLRGKPRRWHDLRGSDSILGAPRQRPAETEHPW